MQISQLDIKKIFKIINEINYIDLLEALYLADSMGSLKPNMIGKIYYEINRKISTPLGIHAHNNKGYALQNTIAAYQSGATWLDSTILGMGRGAGNAETEILLAELKDLGFKKYNPQPLFELSKNYFDELKKKYNWGSSVYYYICAEKNIHPTYLQTLLSDKLIKPEKVFKILNRLGKIDSSSYDKEFLENVLKKTTSENNLKNWSKNSDVLILGNGPKLKFQKSTIEEFIKKNKTKVISLNINKIISYKLINYFVASYLDRILIDLPKYKKLKKPLIIPPHIYKKFINKKKFNKKIIFYEVKETLEKFKVNEKYCIIPNVLAFSYALAISKLGNAKKIFLAGFDGYDDSSDIRNKEMLNTIDIFRKNPKNPKISFITGSKYQI